jgi:4-amino-4-deoxy-L-arabinose transferase-like glycosyltransferase
MRKIDEKYYPYIIALVAGLFFLPFLGHVHLFDWDEINFAESAREMLVTGDYFRVRVGFLPFLEKPPLFLGKQGGNRISEIVFCQKDDKKQDTHSF